ncbi:MAG: methyltransferase domain-containing protein, partial [Bacteroidetes bacterium]|nr:methyltransferase domain-containing protein [Bacteroidota bacterium]
FGSQTENYNEENKHIINYLIDPIRNKHVIKNLDLQMGKGIDFTGNIYNDDFLEHMKQFKFDVILLCNVLEHVVDIPSLCHRAQCLLSENGFIVFSGPNDFPTHYDPIDNGFRPGIEEVKELFKNMEMIKGEVLTDHTYLFYLGKSPKYLISQILRLLTPFYKFEKWKNVFLPKLSYWNKHYKITCVIFKNNINL